MAIYFLYRHIRNDLNVPFYIGIGKKRDNRYKYNERYLYERAYAKKRKNDLWNEIVNTTAYDIEILMESDSLDFIESKEREFISLYGKLYNGSGTLANILDGGMKCTYLPERSRLKLAKPVYVYRDTGEFISSYKIGRQAKRELNINGNIATAIRKRNGFIEGYQIFYEYRGVRIPAQLRVQKRIGNKVFVKNYNLRFEKEYNSALQASVDLKIPYGTIKSRLNNGVPLKGYCFKYIE